MERLDVIVIGAGIGGLSSALLLGRAGHRVTLVERDDTPMPADIEGAFEWDRRGAPQVRHPHAFLALARTILRDRLPDVLQRLLAEGVHEVAMHDRMLSLGPKAKAMLDADDDIKLLGCRRTTFEWVMRTMVLAEPNVTLRVGSGVRSLLHQPADGGVPTVTGVVLEDGTELQADLVVAAAGRRGDVAKWLDPLGVTIAETEHDAGVVYFSRFYRNEAFSEFGFRGAVGSDLVAGVIGADNGTYSITAVVDKNDRELRSFLNESDNFEAVIRLLPEVADVVAAGGVPTHPVHLMTGLINRRRRFTDRAGRPLVAGFAALGDVHTCTNPAYGRGQSLALRQAAYLTDALADHRDVCDAVAAYEAASEAGVVPWYQLSLMGDQARVSRFGSTMRGGADIAAGDGGGGVDLTSLLGLMRYADEIPDLVHRAIRVMNLLDSPTELLMELPRVQAFMESKKQERRARNGTGPSASGSRTRPHRVTREEILAAV